MSRPKIYKQNRQTVWIIVKNKNIQSLMTKQFIWSLSNSLLWLRNSKIVTQKEYRVGCQIMSPHHLCIFICHYQKLYYYCTLTSALTLIFLTIWPPICLFFIKSCTRWYVTAYLHALIQLYYSFTSTCSVLHWYITGPLCKFRIFLHLSFSCKVFVIWAIFRICWYFSDTSCIHTNFLLGFPVPLPKPHKHVNFHHYDNHWWNKSPANFTGVTRPLLIISIIPRIFFHIPSSTSPNRVIW